MESAILLAALLAELDRGEAAGDEVEVESEEGRDDEGKDRGQDVGCHDEVGDLVIERVRVAQCAGNDPAGSQN